MLKDLGMHESETLIANGEVISSTSGSDIY